MTKIAQDFFQSTLSPAQSLHVVRRFLVARADPARLHQTILSRVVNMKRRPSCAVQTAFVLFAPFCGNTSISARQKGTRSDGTHTA